MRRAMEEYELRSTSRNELCVRSVAYDMKHLVDQLRTLSHAASECVRLGNLILSGMDYDVSRLITGCEMRYADVYRCVTIRPLPMRKHTADIVGAHLRNPQLCGG